jgi:hypothetical protein
VKHKNLRMGFSTRMVAYLRSSSLAAARTAAATSAMILQYTIIEIKDKHTFNITSNIESRYNEIGIILKLLCVAKL